MLRFARNTWVLVALLAVTCPRARAADPNEGVTPLSFELSSTTLGPFRGDAAPRFFDSLRPKYVAVVPIRASSRRDFLPLPTQSNLARWFIREFVRSYPGFSAAQQRLLNVKNIEDLFMGNNELLYYYLQGDPNQPAVLLYAMSPEDAKTMARAYAQFCMLAYRTNLGFAERDEEKAAKGIAASQKSLSEVEELLRKSQESLEALRKKAPYRTEQEATQAVGELDRMRNAALVELAGIEAKLAAIQKYQKELPSDQVSRLNAMYVEESIGLFAADARRRTATRLRDEASQFVDLNQTVQKATAEKETLSKRLPDIEKMLKRDRDSIEYMKQNKPQVGGAITIHPIQWTGPAGQN
jgi:hypothetical protein